MHGFGLVETGRIAEGKCAALKGIERESSDTWATHAVAHADEYIGDFKAGVNFLLEREQYWSKCDMLAPHNYWHMGLFYLELNEHEAAIKILDEKILNACVTMNLTNSASLLTRLNIDGYKTNECINSKWLALKDACIGRIEEHGYLYYDLHMAMVLGTCGTNEEKEKYFKSLQNFVMSGNAMWEEENSFQVLGQKKNSIKNYLLSLNQDIGVDLLNAMYYFCQGDYDKVVELLYPIRYQVYKMGGSNAQRDIVNQILVTSALQASSDFNKKLGNALLNERLALMPNSDVTKRIASRFMM